MVLCAVARQKAPDSLIKSAAYSHFADADHVAALVGDRADNLGALAQRGTPHERHRRLLEVVARAGRRNLGVDQPCAPPRSCATPASTTHSGPCRGGAETPFPAPPAR